MNNKINIPCLLFIAMVFGLYSCNKLDQQPVSTASKAAVFGSNNGLELYSNSFYEILPTGNDIIRGDAMADYSARSQVPDFIRPNGYDARLSSGWSWSQLRNINYFIANNNDPKVSSEVRNHHTGLARFFRAYFYFEKVKRFGDVPWISEPMDVNDERLFDGRDPRALVMDSVLADLNFAFENISTLNEDSRSTVTKSVVQAMKSRIALFEGTFRKYHTDLGLSSSADSWLQEAESAAKWVIDNGGFNLYEGNGVEGSYRNLFISKKPVNQEIILSAVADPALNILNDANWWWTSATYGSRVSLNRTFVNTYLTAEGLPFTDLPGHETMVFSEEVKNRDARLQQTIRMGDYKRINGGNTEPAPPVFSYTYTGYQPIKWTLDDTYFDGGTRNDNSISIIRYAEVLLNYAEAKAELGNFTAGDWNLTVGALRKRAGIQNYSNMPVSVDSYMQQHYFPEISDPVLMEIRRERGIELVFEGLRFPDILRWKKGELMEQTWNGFYVPQLDQPMDLNGDGKMDVVFYHNAPSATLPGVTYINVSPTISGGVNPQRLSNGTSGELIWLDNIPRKWEEKLYFYPIPENDIIMNPNLEQNKGW